MDIIYTDGEDFIDLGIMQRYRLDMAFGKDENSFECEVAYSDHVCVDGSFIYVDGTEYGGIVDEVGVNTESESVFYRGRTWHGMLAGKVIVPLTASDTSRDGVIVKMSEAGESLVDRYLIISGEANACLGWLLARIDQPLFSRDQSDSFIDIVEYRFPRYCDAYTGICKMLESVGAKLSIASASGTGAVLSAKEIIATEYTSDQIAFRANRDYRPCNHLICLGAGELENRTRIDLFLDYRGEFVPSQFYHGQMEVAAVFDYPNAESTDELEAKGRERIAELNSTFAEFDFPADAEGYSIGDRISVTDEITGLAAEATIRKKIISLNNGVMTVSYEVGE